MVPKTVTFFKDADLKRKYAQNNAGFSLEKPHCYNQCICGLHKKHSLNYCNMCSFFERYNRKILKTNQYVPCWG